MGETVTLPTCCWSDSGCAISSKNENCVGNTLFYIPSAYGLFRCSSGKCQSKSLSGRSINIRNYHQTPLKNISTGFPSFSVFFSITNKKLCEFYALKWTMVMDITYMKSYITKNTVFLLFTGV